MAESYDLHDEMNPSRLVARPDAAPVDAAPVDDAFDSLPVREDVPAQRAESTADADTDGALVIDGDATDRDEPMQEIDVVSRRRRVAVVAIVAAVVMVLVAVGTAILLDDPSRRGPDAARDTGGGQPRVDDGFGGGEPSTQTSVDPGDGSDGSAPAGTDPSVAGSAPAGPGDQGASAGPEATGGTAAVVHKNGTVTVSVLIGGSDQAVDFDSGVAKPRGQFSGDQRPDLVATTVGLTGLNGAGYVAWTGGARPTASDCQRAGTGRWGGSVLVSVLVVGSVTCMITSEDRIGYFVVASVQPLSGTTVYGVRLEYTVWQ